VAAYTAVAKGQTLDDVVIAAVRQRRPIADARLAALCMFTTRIVALHGFVSDADVAAFKGAGWSDAAMLGVILNVAMKSMTKYVNHIAETPLNPPFEAFAWTPSRKQAVPAWRQEVRGSRRRDHGSQSRALNLSPGPWHT